MRFLSPNRYSMVITSILFLSIALLFLGAGGIARGISEKRMTGWARGMFVAVGAITLGLSIPVVIFSTFGLSVLYAFLAAALIVNGTSYIISGISGVIFKPISLGFGDIGTGRPERRKKLRTIYHIDLIHFS